jgi:cytochrome c-type biogenesis protein CcmH/NrfF
VGRNALITAPRRTLGDVLPDWLLWLLPVPLATLAALLWSWWSTSARGPQDPADSVQEYARFRAALGVSVAATRTPETDRR